MHASKQIRILEILWSVNIGFVWVGKFAGPGNKPVLFIKNICGRQAQRKHLANQQTTNNEYTCNDYLYSSTMSRYRHARIIINETHYPTE